MSGQLTKSRADGSLGTTAQCLDLLGALSYLAIVSLVPAFLFFDMCLLVCLLFPGDELVSSDGG